MLFYSCSSYVYIYLYKWDHVQDSRKSMALKNIIMLSLRKKKLSRLNANRCCFKIHGLKSFVNESYNRINPNIFYQIEKIQEIDVVCTS